MTQRDYSTGISNCHYAVRVESAARELKKLPGAIKLSFKPSSEDRSFIVRSGGGIYTYTSARRSKERPASLEIVSLTKDFLVDVLGWTIGEGGSMIEHAHPDVHISLFYETENGGRPVRHQLYDCVVGEPNFDAGTLTDSLGIDTYKLDLLINPTVTGNNVYSRKIARADNSELFDSWFALRV